ncbi:hypothetical protein Clacol_000209 [Clathrus columnatus]|uniref:F-box domain-containing protein n=1 Tax=Clathrus columnatus TaxID=1419009 RepID=A0AAV4ZY00_9AGAM|nr:hypothetical protein Clacol_000209 [Clathrus columnatus]
MGKNRKNRKQNTNNTQNNTNNTTSTNNNINKAKNKAKKAKNNPNKIEKVTVEKLYRSVLSSYFFRRLTQSSISPEEREANVLKNATVAINRLSTETLVMILSLALSKDPLIRLPYQSVQFSQVCHHWRLAVSDHPAFQRFMVFNKHTTFPFFEKLRNRSPWEVTVRYSDQEPRPLCDLLGENASNEPKIITIDDTDYHELASNFHQLRWLNLTYTDSLAPNSVLELVQVFPNLQVLYLRPEPSGDPETDLGDSAVTLPELKVLITNYCPVMHLINAPKLTYADISVSDDVFQEDAYTHFCGFDFSRITHICSTIDIGDPYIMGKTELDDISPFTFNISLPDSDDDSTFDLAPTPYPNRFYFNYTSCESYNEFDTTRFAACLKQATSLVEIVLNKFVVKGSGKHADVFPFFEPLIGATTIRHFNVLWGGNLELLCETLSNGTICPNLEKLTYSSTGKETQSTSHLLSCLQTLMKERSKTCSKLEVEIKGFDRIPPGELEQVEKLGLQFVQKEQEKTPIRFQKEDYFEDHN